MLVDCYEYIHGARIVPPHTIPMWPDYIIYPRSLIGVMIGSEGILVFADTRIVENWDSGGAKPSRGLGLASNTLNNQLNVPSSR